MHTQNLGKVTESSHNLINNNPFQKKGKLLSKEIAAHSARLGIIANNFVLFNWMFFLPLERVAGRVLQIANIVPRSKEVTKHKLVDSKPVSLHVVVIIT